MIITPTTSQYVTAAVDFNGTNQSLTRAGLSGAVNGKLGIVSFWFRFDGGDGADQEVLELGGGFVEVGKRTSNVMKVILYNALGINIGIMNSTTTYTAGATWHNMMASWDMGNTTGHLYIDGVNVLDTATDLFTNDDIDYTHATCSVGALSGAAFYNGCLADLYFNTTQYLDLSVATNRARFRTTNGKPADLGPQGAQPTGTRPILYLRGPAASINTNLGSGGDFTVNNGPLTTCSTTPSS